MYAGKWTPYPSCMFGFYFLYLCLRLELHYQLFTSHLETIFPFSQLATFTAPTIFLYHQTKIP